MKTLSLRYETGEYGERPWGHWRVVGVGNGFCIKTIVVKKGGKLSLQSHQHRSEHWVVISGKGRVWLNDDVFDVARNQHIFIKAEQRHRIVNIANDDLVFVEVQTGAILDENDIKRFEDIYGRETDLNQ